MSRLFAFAAIVIGFLITCLLYRENICIFFLSMFQNLFQFLDLLKIKIFSRFIRYLRPEAAKKENLIETMNRIKQENAAMKLIVENYPNIENIESPILKEFFEEVVRYKSYEGKILIIAEEKKKEQKDSSLQLETEKIKK